MTETPRNIATSIQARLKNEAEEQGKPFAEVLQYYGMERFLYRLSISEYVDKFILKGGLLLYGWNVPLRRPTRDIDFRGYLDNSRKIILQAIQDIVTGTVAQDGIEFDPSTIKLEETQIDADYEGVRVKFTGYLGRSRIPMQVDIGFSDVLASRVVRVDYPTLLDDTKAPRLKGYPKESIVSEKFHAMIRYAELNSRFKDYYDIWLISEAFEFEGQSLQKAIQATFKQRGTELPTEQPVSLTTIFASTHQTRWSTFLKKMNLENEESGSFVNIIQKIWRFLEHPVQASVSKTNLNLNWSPRKGWK